MPRPHQRQRKRHRECLWARNIDIPLVKDITPGIPSTHGCWPLLTITKHHRPWPTTTNRCESLCIYLGWKTNKFHSHLIEKPCLSCAHLEMHMVPWQSVGYTETITGVARQRTPINQRHPAVQPPPSSAATCAATVASCSGHSLTSAVGCSTSQAGHGSQLLMMATNYF